MTVKIITKFHQILLCLEVETLLNGQYHVASLTNFKSNVFKTLRWYKTSVNINVNKSTL